MRPHYVWIILRKEFLEALRDKRTLEELWDTGRAPWKTW